MYNENSILSYEGINVNSSTKSFILAVESYLDEWETEEYVNYIFEAEGANPSGIRKALNKLTSAFKKKDKRAIASASSEVESELEDFQEEIENADTPEKKKKLSKKTKIIIGALIIAAAAATVVGVKKGAFDKIIAKFKKADKALASGSDEKVKEVAKEVTKDAEVFTEKVEEVAEKFEESIGTAKSGDVSTSESPEESKKPTPKTPRGSRVITTKKELSDLEGIFKAIKTNVESKLGKPQEKSYGGEKYFSFPKSDPKSAVVLTIASGQLNKIVNVGAINELKNEYDALNIEIKETIDIYKLAKVEGMRDHKMGEIYYNKPKYKPRDKNDTGYKQRVPKEVLDLAKKLCDELDKHKTPMAEYLQVSKPTPQDIDGVQRNLNEYILTTEKVVKFLAKFDSTQYSQKGMTAGDKVPLSYLRHASDPNNVKNWVDKVKAFKASAKK